MCLGHPYIRELFIFFAPPGSPTLLVEHLKARQNLSPDCTSVTSALLYKSFITGNFDSILTDPASLPFEYKKLLIPERIVHSYIILQAVLQFAIKK